MNEWCKRALLSHFHRQETELSRIFEGLGSLKVLGMVQFGSTVRGEATEQSDTDLLLVMDPKTPIERHLYQTWETLLKKLSVKTDYAPQFVSLPDDPSLVGSLWYEVAMEGRVLIDPTGRVHQFLSQLRYWILEHQLTRQTSHGHPYWVRGDLGHAK